MHAGMPTSGTVRSLSALIQAAVRSLPGDGRDKLDGRFTGDLKHLKTGQPDTAALGLDNLLGIPENFAYPSIKEGVEAIKNEIERAGTDEDKECLEYVLNQRAGSSPLTFPNSPYPRDCDANGVRADRKDAFGHGKTLKDFQADDFARAAKLQTPHVLALRLYTTAVFKSIVNPLRDASRKDPHRLPCTVHFLNEAIKMLRVVDMRQGRTCECRDLWRGLKDMQLDSNCTFVREGGSESAPMSTTTSLPVAVRYSASAAPMLMRLLTSSSLVRGADVSFLSAFPAEAEILYPPLTFLKVTRLVDVPADEAGQLVVYKVVEVEPTIS